MSKQNSTPPSGGGKEDQKKPAAEHKEHKNENKGHAQPGGGGGGGRVVAISGGGCLAEGCKKKVEKAGFCMEHFDWFKEGLITKEGKKPSDFDKKHFAYMNRKRPAA